MPSPIVLLLAIVFVAVGFSEVPEEEFDPLAAHGGIFRALDWTPAELARISQYHALAEYHQLIEFVKDKMRNSDVDFLTRQRIGKFLKMKRPPSVLRTLLSKKEKHKMKSLHQRGEIAEAMGILRDRLALLGKKDRNRVLQYFGYPTEP
ncbi:hypothetical protein QR680_008081 [Steinernema hermaphroditum]|uniref:Uncharacterized protein n=1 Tax=Steinernema hermaphroditum TaxID=289476 RepID=A0AA39IHP3_9BILA|nr:hypothetical protein QR680_008081 [Steinernema hermaphroditum]